MNYAYIKKHIPLAILVLFVWGLVQPNFGWVTYKPEVYATKIPQQKPLASPVENIFHKNSTLIPVAHFDLEGRVLSKHRYRFDRAASLSPIDIAFGWGSMANRRNAKKIKVFQFKRWYQFFYKEPPIPVGDISSQSANMHLIPSTKEIAREMKRVRRGQIVELKGYLVNATGKDGTPWNTSLSRLDTGDGACEIVWVKDFEIKRK